MKMVWHISNQIKKYNPPPEGGVNISIRESRNAAFSYNKSRKKNNLLNIELNNPYEIERIISVGKRINNKFDIHDRKPGCIIIPSFIFL